VICALVLVATGSGCGLGASSDRQHALSGPPVWVAKAPPVRPLGARVQARIPTGLMAVCSIVPAAGRLWLSAPEERVLLAIDPRRNRVVQRVHVPGKPCLMRSAGGLLWVDLREGLLVAVDPATGRVLRHVRTENTCGYGFDFAAGALWIGEGAPVSTLTRRDPGNGATLATLPPLANQGGQSSCFKANAITAAAGWIWVTASTGLHRVDPRKRQANARVDAGPDEHSTMVAAADRLWLGDDNGDGLHELDAQSGRTLAVYRFGGGALAGGGGRVWTTGGRWANEPAGRVPVLVEIDPRRHRVVARYRVGRDDPGFEGERTPAEADWPLAVQRALSGAGLADGSLWIHHNAERRLYRIDPS
jgi:hypothetical protein